MAQEVVQPLRRAFCLLCGDRAQMLSQVAAEEWAKEHQSACRKGLYRQPRHEWRWPLGNGQDIVLTAFTRDIKQGEPIYIWPDHGGGFPQMTVAKADLEYHDRDSRQFIVPVVGSIYSVEPERDL